MLVNNGLVFYYNIYFFINMIDLNLKVPLGEY